MIQLPWTFRSRAVAEQAADASLLASLRDLRNDEPHTARQLNLRSEDLRQRAIRQSPEATMPDAFALFDLALERVKGHRCYAGQFVAARALVRGQIAEMATGEGKTIVTALAAYALALKGRGVHIATENRYLAARDAEIFRGILEPLGISVGLINEEQTPAEKQQAYDCDLTCGPGYEFGFDYLRDQLTRNSRSSRRLGEDLLATLSGRDKSSRSTLQRGLWAAIIDEIDSVLIDDACSPLIIATPDPQGSSPELYRLAETVAGEMTPGEDFQLDGSRLVLTESGRQRCYELPEGFAPDHLLRPWSEYVLNALRARHLMQREVHYVVSQGTIAIVDRTTGRIFDQRTWRNGLHQAIQVREGLEVSSEHRSSATITRQRFFRLYSHLCGTTGTARESEREFRELYQLPIKTIPLRLPSRRNTHPPLIYPTREQKWEAVTREIQQIHHGGQPILVGTTSIGDSHRLAGLLSARNLSHTVLNGVQDRAEADIIAQAGQPGAITVATNMAGRGTDIKLPEESRQRGGLAVIGTEFHESTRTDRQLIGRAARQGEPGSARFLCSAEDPLWTGFGSSRIVLPHSISEEGSPLDLRWVHALQRRQEQHAFQMRKATLEQDRRRESLLSDLPRTGS